jgi:hypothetical protein
MRIVEENTVIYGYELIEITSAQYKGELKIRIDFSNGKSKIVDFKPFLTRAFHPSIKKYLDENLFISFKVIDGNLNWNDYDMIFPVSDLYQGKIK